MGSKRQQWRPELNGKLYEQVMIPAIDSTMTSTPFGEHHSTIHALLIKLIHLACQIDCPVFVRLLTRALTPAPGSESRNLTCSLEMIFGFGRRGGASETGGVGRAADSQGHHQGSQRLQVIGKKAGNKALYISRHRLSAKTAYSPNLCASKHLSAASAFPAVIPFSAAIL